MEYVLEVQDITKRYGPTVAVNQMSLQIKKGDIYGLIGNNGAGKTTLMKLALGLAVPDHGTMRLFGSEKLDNERRKIGALIETPVLYKNETAYENMKRFAILTGSSDQEIRELLDLVALGDTGKKKAGQFSLGMRQRLAIAIALLGNPQFMILDEPVNGLDPAGIKEIRDVILRLHQRGVTFLISSHLLDELGKIATCYGIISKGCLVQQITAEELAQICRGSLEIQVDDCQKAMEILKEAYPDLEITTKDGILLVSSIVDSGAVNECLVKAGTRVNYLYRKRISSEDFFIERMG